MWYEADLVDEDDIKKWHSSPTTQGINVEPEDYGGELNKLWGIGGRLLAHLESDDESEEDSEEDSEDEEPAVQTLALGTGSSPAIRTAVEESDDGEEGTEESDDEEVPSKLVGPAAHAAKTAAPPPTLSSSAPTAKPKVGPLKQTEESEEENSEDDESDDGDDLPASKPTVAVKPQATPRTTALPNQEADEEESEEETDDDSEAGTPARNPQSAIAGASQNRPAKPVPPSVLAKPSIAKPIATQKHQAVEQGKTVTAYFTGEADYYEDDDEEEDDDDDDE